MKAIGRLCSSNEIGWPSDLYDPDDRLLMTFLDIDPSGFHAKVDHEGFVWETVHDIHHGPSSRRGGYAHRDNYRSFHIGPVMANDCVGEGNVKKSVDVGSSMMNDVEMGSDWMNGEAQAIVCDCVLFLSLIHRVSLQFLVAVALGEVALVEEQ